MTYEQAAEILGVDPDEEDEALLRKAFRKQSLLHHPDKNPGDPTATARFQNIGQALEMLMRRARGEASDEEGDDPFGDDFFRGATQDFDDEEAFGDFVRMMRDFMKMRTRFGMGVHVGGGLFFNFGHGPSDSDYDSEDQGYSRDYEKERFDDKARNMWLKREEYAAQDELDRDERRAQREARQAEVEANKKVKKQRKETARTRFATRLGVALDGKLRYLDWSFSALKGEADKRKLKRSKLVDGATLAHLLLDDDERQAKRKKKIVEAPAVVATPPSPVSLDAESDNDFGQAAFFSRVAQKRASPRVGKKQLEAQAAAARAAVAAKPPPPKPKAPTLPPPGAAPEKRKKAPRVRKKKAAVPPVAARPPHPELDSFQPEDEDAALQKALSESMLLAAAAGPPTPPPAPARSAPARPALPAGLSVGDRARLRAQQASAPPPPATPPVEALSVGARARLRREQQAAAAAPPVPVPPPPPAAPARPLSIGDRARLRGQQAAAPAAPPASLSVGERARQRREQQQAAAPPPVAAAGLSVGARAKLRRQQMQQASAAPPAVVTPFAPPPPAAPPLSVGARARQLSQAVAPPPVSQPYHPEIDGYDESQYTTSLDDITPQQRADAERIAREIETGNMSAPHGPLGDGHMSVGARTHLRRQQEAAPAAPAVFVAPAPPPVAATAGLSVGARARLRREQQAAAAAPPPPAPAMSVGERARLRAQQAASPPATDEIARLRAEARDAEIALLRAENARLQAVAAPPPPPPPPAAAPAGDGMTVGEIVRALRSQAAAALAAPAPPPLALIPPMGGGWVCSSCTIENPNPNHLVCFLCNTARPVG